MQLKNVLAVFAALNLVTAAPTPDEDGLEIIDGPEGGADEFEIVKRGQATFYCKGAVVSGLAGTNCGTQPAFSKAFPNCNNLYCYSGKYIAWPAPKPYEYKSYIVCQK
ncbi:uncharacterized protein BO95DRAFT_497706 [Aspergillus brunneoviolaceus CBS 621.78]|uniref:Uncharacterized protein n=2 Tax=Aspergillus TaxID=5052 RepID=A0A8G1RGA8_9EURO|nr:hypothetical protein BO95DRAFT_497706 [Aspergillus brunneoviolaceus CBS 621.78]XP_040795287.1 uncharacterized protein BO72DRAFT_463952 [Aspergillus fijiensis CBS 313.89]RAH50451.1 hypothetical protein BO95DRAFT_497706 [Aspergillus brunneoviolaceus CBS 621.78]RAK71275.1 hypothetical protein BO72DRAFT_463952 [Aspergillus fijiensis CBS 313.89]